MKNHRLKRCLLSKMNSFDYNSMKLGLIIKYHNFFFKFEMGLYPIMPSGVIVLCSWQFPIYVNLAIAGASVSMDVISRFVCLCWCLCPCQQPMIYWRSLITMNLRFPLALTICEWLDMHNPSVLIWFDSFSVMIHWISYEGELNNFVF